MNINSFNIDTATMPSIETVRQFSVNGEVGAEFQIIALESGTLKYYDFLNSAFELGHNDSNNNLTITLNSPTYINNITFPSGAGDYVIKLIALNGTTINYKATNVISKDISKQATAAEITFKAGTANTNNYETFTETTSTGTLNSSATVSFDWDITNKINDGYGFGLLQSSTTPFKELDLLRETSLIKRAITQAWYFETTENTAETVIASTEIKVDDLTELVVGMLITGVSGGDSLSGTPFIKKIDIKNKTLHISTAQTFNKLATLTFKAYGSKMIYLATGAMLDFGGVNITPTILTKTIRASSSESAINLNGTYGIAGGNIVTILGLGLDNSDDNAVTSVSASSSAGSITVQNAQTGLTTGSTIYFTGCFAVINFKGNLKISSFPETDKTIYLDVDKFLAVGVSGL